VAWFGLFGGITLIVVGGVAGGRDGGDVMMVGVGLAIAATCGLSAPIFLREVRKEELL